MKVEKQSIQPGLTDRKNKIIKLKPLNKIIKWYLISIWYNINFTFGLYDSAYKN